MALPKHGKFGTREYWSWAAMKGRCGNPLNQDYKRYGGRGIKVCERWEKFENFYADMGPAPEKHTLDRIDNNGNYEPANCRWATLAAQCRNRSTNVMVDFRGHKMCLKDAAKLLGLCHQTLMRRLKDGVELDQPRRKSGKKAIRTADLSDISRNNQEVKPNPESVSRDRSEG